jgi:hypothetical protein
MTVSTLQLNYWVFGDYPVPNCTSVVSPSHRTIFQLKKQLIQENKVELRGVNADNLRIWSVSDLIPMVWHVNADELDVSRLTLKWASWTG